MKRLPDINLLREVLSYDPHTGVLRWSEAAPRNRGRQAGSTNPSGYKFVRLRVEGKVYSCYAHRIAYALHYGDDPYPMEIDHINRNVGDNAIANLRIATRSLQNKNRHPHANNNAHIANRKPVRITYPDGRGAIVVDSAATAARILNVLPSRITYNARRGTCLHWGWGFGSTSSGIRLSYV